MKKLSLSVTFLLIGVMLVCSSAGSVSPVKNIPADSVISVNSLYINTWVLQTLNGKEVVKEKAGKEIPFLKFNLKDSGATGNTGCNDVYGKAIVTGDEITFSEMIMTKMFCSDAQYEQEFVDVLFYKGALKYKIDGGNLSLFKDGAEVMVLKKKD